MKLGTRSLLFGYHLFWLHPFFVALGWFKLYGAKKIKCNSSGVETSIFDPRLWVCFLVHDWGYFGAPNMDGPEGEQHPKLGADIVHRWFDAEPCNPEGGWKTEEYAWKHFLLYHSRFLAKLNGRTPSLFCHADKASIWLTPSRIAVPLMRLSREIKEYRSRETRPENSVGLESTLDTQITDWEWWFRIREWCKAYCLEHKDGKQDTWTRR